MPSTSSNHFLETYSNVLLSINALRARDGRLLWRADAQGQAVTADTQVFSPPALGRRMMYLCSSQGHLLAINQKTGKVAFMYALQQPTIFQPILAGGNIYLTTSNGLLICIKTGDMDADGWTAWGGNAQHNATR